MNVLKELLDWYRADTAVRQLFR